MCVGGRGGTRYPEYIESMPKSGHHTEREGCHAVTGNYPPCMGEYGGGREYGGDGGICGRGYGGRGNTRQVGYGAA